MTQPTIEQIMEKWFNIIINNIELDSLNDMELLKEKMLEALTEATVPLQRRIEELKWISEERRIPK